MDERHNRAQSGRETGGRAGTSTSGADGWRPVRPEGPERRRQHVLDDATQWTKERAAEARRQLRLLAKRAATAHAFDQIIVVEAVLLVFLIVFILLWTPAVGDLDRESFNRATIVYAANGEEITRFFRENRTWVELEDVSPHVVDALIATEDRRFYEHSGIDVIRTIGAVFNTMGGSTQGGSTITMQLARNAFPEFMQDPMLVRKVKEWITAFRIELAHDKDDILEMYLNTVPFIFHAYGIEAAALTYFDKHAGELDVLEAATLVGMLKGPSLYNPVLNPERSRERRNVVLANLVEQGRLEPERLHELRERPTRLRFRPTTAESNIAPHFVEHVRRQLEAWAERKGYNLYASGLRVHTTLDVGLQRSARTAFDETMEDLQAVVDVSWSERSVPFFSRQADAYAAYRDRIEPFKYFWEAHPHVLSRVIRKTERYADLKDGGLTTAEALDRLRADTAFTDSLKAAASILQGGFVAIDPNDGHVKAWVGGRDFARNKFDHVAQAKRQPGSTFKPFVYGAALENGYMPDDALPDWAFSYVNNVTGQSWAPDNFGGSSGSLMTLRQALAYSKNTITAQLVMRLGADRVVDFAERAGIRTELDAVPSIALGTSPVSLLELTAAYATFANLGRYRAPVTVTRIENHEGEVIARFAPPARRAIAEHVAYGILDMMRGVVDRGTGARIRSQFGARGELAGKTGTTQHAADGWFMLIHPNLVMGSWVGFDIQELTLRTSWWGQGSHTALQTVGRFQNLIDLPQASFDRPAELRDGMSLARLLRERRGPDNADGPLPWPAGSDWKMASLGDGWTGPAPGTPGFNPTNWLNFQERRTSPVRGYLKQLSGPRN